MLTKYLKILLLAVSLSACSYDEEVETPPAEPTARTHITFGPVALDDSPSRAADPDTADPDTAGTITTENISAFNICAFLTANVDSLLMDNVTVTRSGPNQWSYPNPVRWPGEEPVTFQAVAPIDMHIAINPWWGSTVEVSMADTVAGQEYVDGTTDLVIAANVGATSKGGKVRLNFRHAMSRIQIHIAGDIPDATVVVKEIALDGMIRYGHCFVPQHTTLPQDVIGQMNDCWPEWAQDTRHGLSVYFRADDGREVPLTDRMVSLNNRDNHFFVPLKLQPLATRGDKVDGSSIRVLAKIIRSSDGARIWPNGLTPRQLFPNQDVGGDYAYIHFALRDDSHGLTTWLPGYNYNYELTVRNAGTLPDAPTGRSSAPNALSVTATPY